MGWPAVNPTSEAGRGTKRLGDAGSKRRMRSMDRVPTGVHGLARAGAGRRCDQRLRARQRERRAGDGHDPYMNRMQNACVLDQRRGVPDIRRGCCRCRGASSSRWTSRSAATRRSSAPSSGEPDDGPAPAHHEGGVPGTLRRHEVRRARHAGSGRGGSLRSLSRCWPWAGTASSRGAGGRPDPHHPRPAAPDTGARAGAHRDVGVYVRASAPSRR